MLQVIVDAQLGLIIHRDQLGRDLPGVVGEQDDVALPPARLLLCIMRGFRFWDNMASVSAPG